MTEIILTITITLPEPEPPAPDRADKPEPVLTKEQPPVCRCREYTIEKFIQQEAGVRNTG